MTEKTSSSLDKVIIEPKGKATASVIWLHGLGADGYDFVDIIPQLNLPSDLNVRFIFPHAPVRPISINAGIRMRAWYDVYSLNDLQREDTANILAAQSAIEMLIDDQLHAGISSQQIVLAGFSQGGAVALYAGLRHSQTLGGILALSTYLPLAASTAEEADPANQSTPIFMAHGEFDDILPIKLGIFSREQLIQLHYTVEWHSYPMGHQVCNQEITDIATWLRKCLDS